MTHAVIRPVAYPSADAVAARKGAERGRQRSAPGFPERPQVVSAEHPTLAVHGKGDRHPAAHTPWETIMPRPFSTSAKEQPGRACRRMAGFCRAAAPSDGFVSAPAVDIRRAGAPLQV